MNEPINGRALCYEQVTLKEEYDDLMEHCKASKEQGDYEAAEYFFNQAQKVWEVQNETNT